MEGTTEVRQSLVDSITVEKAETAQSAIRFISAAQADLKQSAVQGISGERVNLEQSAVLSVRANDVSLSGSAAVVAMGTRITAENCRTLFLCSPSVSGDVRAAITSQQALAFGLGFFFGWRLMRRLSRLLPGR